MSSIKSFTTLKNSKEYARAYNKPTKVWHTPYFVLFYKKDTEYKVGFVASKKIGKAVQRNRAKRLLRAHFIEAYDLLQSGSYALVAKQPLLDEAYVKVHKTFTNTLDKVYS